MLKRLQANYTLGEVANVNLFDDKGVLLLHKDQPITQGIRKHFKNLKLYVLQNQGNLNQTTSEKSKAFSENIYIYLVSSLWDIFHEAEPIHPEKIKKTLMLVESIIKELQSDCIYFNFNAFHLVLEKYKQESYCLFSHLLNVALLAAVTGMKLGYTGERLENLILGAYFHDIGKLKVPKEIINKPGKLTDEEYNVIKQHPIYGEKMLINARLHSNVLAGVREHHERWNGKGYPYGLNGNSINMDAQIIAVADVYDALTSDRPYRERFLPYQALEMIIDWIDKDFNPEVVQAFRESLILYPENAIFTLNT